jgi:hypothetical protein
MSKSFQTCPKSQKKDKNIYETLKGSSCGYTEEKSKLLELRTKPKDFVEEFYIQLFHLVRNSKGFVDIFIFFLETLDTFVSFSTSTELFLDV